MKVKSHAALGQVSAMDLRLLRVFKSVVECGGMAAAELELNIGISTVSRHYAQAFERSGQMRAIQPDLFRYTCSFFSIVWRSPQPFRVTRAFQHCLLKAHVATTFD